MANLQLQPTFDKVVYKALKPLCLSLSIVCIALVAVGAYYYDGSSTSMAVVASDALCALLYLGIYLCADRYVRPEHAQVWGFALGAIAAANALFSFYLQQTPFILSYIPIIALGFGAFLLSTRWLAISLISLVVVTAMVASTVLATEDYLLYTPILLAACIFSVLTMMVRRAGFSSAHEAMLEAEAQAVQREAVEHQLAQSQRLDSLGRLVSGVAHDFNNLMMVVIGYSDTLLDNAPAGATRDGLSQIRKAGESAASLAAKLLAFSRQQVLQPRLIATNDIVEGARGLIAKSLPPGVTLQMNLDPDCGYVTVDPMQMEQVLLNLALNAKDAMETTGGGVLTISTRPGRLTIAAPAEDVETMACVIEVADTGIGMSQEIQDLAFEPFFTTKEADRGTGLGLASVHGIITQSGGNIEIESKAGVGTTFRIELPRMASDEAEAPGKDAGHNRTLSGHSLLVVDDEAEIRDIVAATLENYGAAVATADSAATALDMTNTGAYDLILTDIVMPNMSGLDFADELARRGYLRPVVFMSGNAAQVAARAPGVVSKTPFISKPFRAAELIQVITETLADAKADSRTDAVA